MRKSGAPEHLQALTSLRFVAAMMIVLFHAKNYFHWPLLRYVPSAAAFGVSFFFVLSGFILTHVYSSKPFPGYWRFIALRIGRLWPVHLFATAIVVASLFSPVTIIRTDSLTFSGSGFIFSRWTELWLVIPLLQSLSPYMAHFYAWNSPSWSISTEFFFYLAFPWLLLNIGRTWHWKLLASAVIAVAFASAMLWLGFPTISSDPFSVSVFETMRINPLSRIFEFCLGMSAWVLWDRRLRHLKGSTLTWTVAELLSVLATLAWCLDAYPVVRTMLPEPLELWFVLSGPAWAFFALIVTFASGRGLIGRALSAPPAVLLGEISFSIYMLHQILMKIFVTYGITNLPSIAFFAPLFALSATTFFILEIPARDFFARLVKPQHRRQIVSATATA